MILILILIGNKFNKDNNYKLSIKMEKTLKDLSYLFYKCFSYKTINLYNFDTLQVLTMKEMFSSCHNLEFINFYNFNTQNLIDMRCLFFGCSSLILIDLPNFKTDKVTNMSSMFNGCSNLKEIKGLNNFITDNIIKICIVCFMIIQI